MKISTFSSLYTFIFAFAFSFGTSRSELISANTNITSATSPTMTPSVFAPSLALLDFDPSFDPSGGRLSLMGLDPSEPLSKAEAAFLEATIREVFNSISEDMGIDLVADSVVIAKEVIVDADNNDANSNLRGRRNLPWNDQEMCTYQVGPNKGESIPGCIFDIDFYMDCYCHLCRDDDFVWDGNKITNPTPPPTPPPTRSPTAHPVAPPTVVGCNMCRDDDFTFDGNNIYKPTRAPTRAPIASPIEEEEDVVGLEEERGPDQPSTHIYVPRPEDVGGEKDRGPPTLIYVQTPPPAAAPIRRRSNKNKNKNKNRNKSIDFELLKKLQQSPFHRFRKIRKVRFGGRN